MSKSTAVAKAPRDTAARSIAAAAAIYGGPVALGQVWAFIVAPLVGAAIAGLAHRALTRAAHVPA